MSTALIPAKELASSDWQLVEDGGPRPLSLVVQLRKRVYVLPYFRFVYAEGDNTQVKISFASHLVTVTGHGLAALLATLGSNIVVRLILPVETESNFGVRGDNSDASSGPSITDITVAEYK